MGFAAGFRAGYSAVSDAQEKGRKRKAISEVQGLDTSKMDPIQAAQAQANIYEKYGLLDQARNRRLDASTLATQAQNRELAGIQESRDAAMFGPRYQNALLQNRLGEQTFDQNERTNPLRVDLMNAQVVGANQENAFRAVSDPLRLVRLGLQNTQAQQDIAFNSLANPKRLAAMDQDFSLGAQQYSRIAALTPYEVGSAAEGLRARQLDNDLAAATFGANVFKSQQNARDAGLTADWNALTFRDRADQQRIARNMAAGELGLFNDTRNAAARRAEASADQAEQQVQAGELELANKERAEAWRQLSQRVAQGDPNALNEIIGLGATVYNGNIVGDDDNQVIQDREGRWYLQPPDGGPPQPAIEALNAMSPADRQSVLTRAMVYAQVGATGDFSPIADYYQNIAEREGKLKKADMEELKAISTAYKNKATQLKDAREAFEASGIDPDSDDGRTARNAIANLEGEVRLMGERMQELSGAGRPDSAYGEIMGGQSGDGSVPNPRAAQPESAGGLRTRPAKDILATPGFNYDPRDIGPDAAVELIDNGTIYSWAANGFDLRPWFNALQSSGLTATQRAKAQAAVRRLDAGK